MAEWRNGGMADWRNDRMAEWWNGGMADWGNGGMAEWQNGGMAEWHNVRYEIVRNQDTESTQMPPWRSPSRLVYIQMMTQSDECHLFAGDLSTYRLQCKRCGQHVTLHGSVEDTLFHAPNAMLYHWNMMEPNDEQMHRELMFMPLLVASYYQNYVRSSKSFQEGLSWMEDLNICQKPTKYGQSMFCEAVKVDLENSKESSFHHTITNTLSLITVLLEDLFEAISLHRDFSGEKVRL